MADYGSTERVRRSAAQLYVEPARRRGETIIKIHSGTFGKTLVANHLLSSGRYPIICNALKSTKFQKENGLTLLEIQGPPTVTSGKSSTITFVYRLEANAPSPITLPKKSLFDQLRGVSKKRISNSAVRTHSIRLNAKAGAIETCLLGHHALRLLA